MECPVSNHPDDIRDEKCKVLRCIPPVEEQDCLLGQYTAGRMGPEARAVSCMQRSVWMDPTTVFSARAWKLRHTLPVLKTPCYRYGSSCLIAASLVLVALPILLLYAANICMASLQYFCKGMLTTAGNSMICGTGA